MTPMLYPVIVLSVVITGCDVVQQVVPAHDNAPFTTATPRPTAVATRPPGGSGPTAKPTARPRATPKPTPTPLASAVCGILPLPVVC